MKNRNEAAAKSAAGGGRSRDRKARRSGDLTHKLKRLCEEIREVVQFVLADSAHAAELEAVSVLDVVADESSGQILILLVPLRALDMAEAAQVERALTSVRAYVRREIAEAIQRKRAPEIALVLLPLPAEDPEQP